MMINWQYQMRAHGIQLRAWWRLRTRPAWRRRRRQRAAGCGSSTHATPNGAHLVINSTVIIYLLLIILLLIIYLLFIYLLINNSNYSADRFFFLYVADDPAYDPTTLHIPESDFQKLTTVVCWNPKFFQEKTQYSFPFFSALISVYDYIFFLFFLLFILSFFIIIIIVLLLIILFLIFFHIQRKQYWKTKKAHYDHITFFQVGDFFELFEKDAGVLALSFYCFSLF